MRAARRTTLGMAQSLLKIVIPFLFGCGITLQYSLWTHTTTTIHTHRLGLDQTLDSEEKRMLKPQPQPQPQFSPQGEIEIERPLPSPTTRCEPNTEPNTAPNTAPNTKSELPPSTKRKPPVSGKHQSSPQTLQSFANTPIIVVGMMKAGTTSIFAYFKCGMRLKDYALLSHYDCNPPKHRKREDVLPRMACGRRMRNNIEVHKVEPFTGMDQFVLYAEIDGQGNDLGMTLPQWTYLDQIHGQFPNATFVLNLRDPKHWMKSIDKWKDLRQRFIKIHIPPVLPRGVGANDTDLELFYLAQAQRVRDFVADHPTHELVEVSIESPNAGQIMQDSFGITKECWGVRNSNTGGNATWTMN